MKEFVGRDARQVFIRIDADCSGVCVLHASATCSLANVENERVAPEWCSIHELQFVLTNSPQVFFNVFPAPVISMDHNPDLGLKSGQLKHRELPGFDGCVDERIVTFGITTETSGSAHRFNKLN